MSTAPGKGTRSDQEASIPSGGRNGIQQLGSHAKRRSLGRPRRGSAAPYYVDPSGPMRRLHRMPCHPNQGENRRALFSRKPRLAHASKSSGYYAENLSDKLSVVLIQ